VNRRISNISAVLCVGVIAGFSVLWARSYFHPSAFCFSRHDRRWEIVADHGRLRVDNVPQLMFENREITRQSTIVAARARTYMGAMIDGARVPDAGAFEIAHAVDAVTANRTYAESLKQLERLQKLYITKPTSRSISFAVPMAVLCQLPAWRLRAWLNARRRKRKGLCANCGYDLRATAQRCPECGKPIPPQVHSSPAGEVPPADFVRPRHMG
jgi:hypothetical protein